MRFVHWIEAVLAWIDKEIGERYHHILQVVSVLLLVWAVKHHSDSTTVTVLAGLTGGTGLGVGAISVWRTKIQAENRIQEDAKPKGD